MPDGSEARIDALLAQLTLEEKLLLCAGADAWHTHAIPRVSIPAIKVTDGPHGARGGTFGENTAASFPCGTAMGATWDPELVGETAAAIGQEARTKQARVQLAPTVNIHRHPLAGRNFECYSEDPYLTARMAVAFVEGVQGQGVAATVKHFICNDSESGRITISPEVRERALREIYLPPFEAAVKEASAWVVMTSYNRINGTYAAENQQMLSILSDEWGFDGLVMSDWWGTTSTVASANAGLDLEMPGPGYHFGKRLGAAVDAGEVSEETIESKTRRLLRLAVRTRAFDEPSGMDEVSDDRPEHRALIRRAAAESMVLLKNQADLLPLRPPDGALIAVIGPNGDELCTQGGGSSRVEPHHETPFIDALRTALGPGVNVEFEAGGPLHPRTPPLGPQLTNAAREPGVLVEYFNNAEFQGEPALTLTMRRFDFRWLGATRPAGITGEFTLRATATFTAPATGAYRFTLTSSGLSRLLLDGELALDNWTQQTPGRSFYGQGSSEIGVDIGLDAGETRTVVLEYLVAERARIPGVVVGCRYPEPHNGIERAVELARRADAVVLVAGLNSDWEAEGADRVSLNLPGEQDALIAEVTAANPNTVVVINAGSPVAMPWLETAGAVLQAWYPGQEGGDALADVLVGKADPAGRLPTTFAARVEDHPSNLTYPGEAGEVHYGEDIFVGYRAFDRTGAEPLFPFGHGLSYTTFAYENVKLDKEEIRPGESVTVSLRVANTGETAGCDVVQVYVGDLESSLLRPAKELKGFQKVRLAPGERKDVAIVLDPRAFQAWDPRVHGWVAEPGEFVIYVGWSSASFAAELPLRLVE